MYISLPVLARLRRENAKLQVLWRTLTSDDEFLFLSLKLSALTQEISSRKIRRLAIFSKLE